MGEIRKQGISNTIITYIGIFIGFLNVIFIQPTYLTPEELGLVRVLYSFSAIIAMFLPLGIGSITQKYFPIFKDKEKKHHGFFGILLLFTLAGFVLVSAILFLARDFIVSQYIQESKLFVEYFYYVFPLSLILSLIAIFGIYCQSLFKSTFPTLLNDVLVRILAIVLVSVYFIKIISLDQLVYGFVSIYALQVFILLIYIYIIDKPTLRINVGFYKQHNRSEILTYGLLLSFTAFASLGIKYLDVIFIGKYLPLAFAGIYSVAVFIPTVIEAPIGALEKISNSKIADAWARKNTKEIDKIYFESSKYLLLLGGLLFLGVNINIKYLFELLPNDYSLGINVVFILSISTLFNMATGLNAGIIYSSDNYIYGSFLLFLLLFLSVTTNIMLIPRYGLNGAALATAISSFIYNLLKYLFIWYKFKMQPFDKNTFYVTALIIACYFLNKLIPDSQNTILNIIAHSTIITLTYLSVVYFLNVVPEFHRYIPFLKSKP